MSGGAALPSPFAVFRRRDFRLLVGAQFISNLGSGLTTIAAAILVYQLTSSALMVSLLLVAVALPTLLLGMVAGALVDRLDRRRVMLAAQVARAALVALIPLLAPHSIAWVYALLMLSSVAESFYGPALASALPDAAPSEELAAANALMTVVECTALSLGYAGTGLLAGVGQLAWAFWLDALSYVGAAACIALAQLRQGAAGERQAGVLAQLREGLAYVRDTPILRALFIVFIPSFATWGLSQALMLPFATRALGASALEYGLIEAAMTVGFIVGGLVMATYGERLHAGQWVAGSIFLMGFSSIGLALSPTFWPALLAHGLNGLLNTPSYVGRSLIIQRHAPSEARGRVFGAFCMVRDGLFLAGMALAGLADLLDVRALMLASALVLVACGALALRFPGLGQPSAEWRRALRMLRTAPQSATLGLGRAATLDDVAHLADALPEVAALSPARRAELAESARVLALEAGTVVVRQGERSSAVYFLLAGRTVALAGEGGGEILETHAAGDFFGEIAALTDVPRTATVIVDAPAQLLQLPAPTLRRFMGDAGVSRLLLAKLAERVQRLQLFGADRAAARSLDRTSFWQPGA